MTRVRRARPVATALRLRTKGRCQGREQRHIEGLGRHTRAQESQRVGRTEPVRAACGEPTRLAAVERALRVEPAHPGGVVEHAASSPLIPGMHTDHAAIRFTAADRNQLVAEIGLTDQSRGKHRRRNRIERDPKQLDEPRQAAVRLSSAARMQPPRMITRENRRPSGPLRGAPCFRGDPTHTCQRHAWRDHACSRMCTSMHQFPLGMGSRSSMTSLHSGMAQPSVPSSRMNETLLTEVSASTAMPSAAACPA